LEALLRQHRLETAELGAAGLLAAGEVPAIVPLDDEDTLDAAAPRRAGEAWEFDVAKVRRRDECIVRNAVASGATVVVVILGGSHDLTEVMKEQAPGWAYTRVVTRAVQRVPR